MFFIINIIIRLIHFYHGLITLSDVHSTITKYEKVEADKNDV